MTQIPSSNPPTAPDDNGMKSADPMMVQAGAIPVTMRDEDVQVLLITTRSGRWSIPKGGVMRGQTLRAAAEMEALEEAGVVGPVIEPVLGTYEYTKRGLEHHVTLFPMLVGTVLADWKERRERSRQWVSLRNAPRLIDVTGQAKIVHASLDLLEQLCRTHRGTGADLVAG